MNDLFELPKISPTPLEMEEAALGAQLSPNGFKSISILTFWTTNLLVFLAFIIPFSPFLAKALRTDKIALFWGIFLAVLALIVVVCSACAISSIPAQKIALVQNRFTNLYYKRSFGPGYHLIPIFFKIHLFDATEKNLRLDITAEFPRGLATDSALIKDSQIVYRLDPDFTCNLLRIDIDRVFQEVQTRLSAAFKSSLPKTIKTLGIRRDDFSQKQELLMKDIELDIKQQLQRYGFKLTSLTLGDLDLSQETIKAQAASEQTSLRKDALVQQELGLVDDAWSVVCKVDSLDPHVVPSQKALSDLFYELQGLRRKWSVEQALEVFDMILLYGRNAGAKLAAEALGQIDPQSSPHDAFFAACEEALRYIENRVDELRQNAEKYRTGISNTLRALDVSDNPGANLLFTGGGLLDQPDSRRGGDALQNQPKKRKE